MYSCLPGFKPEISDQEMVTECTMDGNFSLEMPPNCKGKWRYRFTFTKFCKKKFYFSTSCRPTYFFTKLTCILKLPIISW